MTNQFDITKHQWSDGNLSSDIAADKFSIKLRTDNVNYTLLSFNKDDAIAIAKHFGILDIKWLAENQYKLHIFGESITEMDEGGKRAFKRETKEFSAREL